MALAHKEDKRYSYFDYENWPDEERWELIDGAAYDMSPAPGIKHQNAVLIFSRILGNKLFGKTCRPFIAPTDVVLSEYDVVQPDVFVVCDKNKITEKNIQGAPDLVVEVLFPSTVLKDKREKKALYEKYGVKEYILVDPMELYAERFLLEKKGYGGAEIFGPQEILSLKSMEGIDIPLWEVFEVDREEPHTG